MTVFLVDLCPPLCSVFPNPAVFDINGVLFLDSSAIGSLPPGGGCPAVNRKTKITGKAPTLTQKVNRLPLYGTGGAFLRIREVAKYEKGRRPQAPEKPQSPLHLPREVSGEESAPNR